MFDVIGLGENSVDEICRLAEWPPRRGAAKIRIEERTVATGGQVATTMAGCARLGLRARYVGVFGNDDFGARIRSALESRGVDTSLALVRDAPNRRAVILVDAAGERVVLWQRDPRLRIAPDEVRSDWTTGARVLHVDGVDEEAAIAAARAARAAGLHVTSDIEHVTPRTDALVAAVSVPIFAEHAVTSLTGHADPALALRAVRQRHGGPLCVTLGARGAMLLDGDALIHEPALPAAVVDTTGAGDVFRAGFIYGLIHGLPPRQILRVANAAAALSCTRTGAMDSVPALEDVRRAMALPA